MLAGLEEISIEKVFVTPNSTSCSPRSDIASCLHSLHIHRPSHCFDNQLKTTCKTAGLKHGKVQAISAAFQSEADVKSVTIYNPQVEFPSLPTMKVVELNQFVL